MLDPNWQKGYYYNTGKFPRTGMKLARLAKQEFPSTRTLYIVSLCYKDNVISFQGDSYFNLQGWRRMEGEIW